MVRRFPESCLTTVVLFVFAATWLLLASPAGVRRASAQTDPAPKTDEDGDGLEVDYASQLPRIPATAPSQAPKTFRLPDGFRIRAIATEPLVTDPVAIAFDEHERIYVVEMRDYSEQDKEHLGRVRLLEDQDGDGFYETSRIFVEGLSWPTAIACYDGGVFVGAAPHLFYFKDQDGDGAADVKRTVFTGFGRGNVQGLMNSFKWGLDNRIHAATSSSGATVTSPEHPDHKPIVLRGRDFSFDPKTLQLQPESGGAQHGLSFNRWGEKFVCSNSNHIQQVLYDDAYAARNPYVKAPAPRASIAADGPQADVFRASPIEPWRIVRTRLRVKGIVRGPVEGGGTPAGYFTGATGVTLFRGDAWSPELVDWAIIGDVGSNLIHRKKLTRNGIAYTANRVDKQSEFLTSNDIWFRPVQFANGPAGGLYVLDMYREVIEHPKSLPPVIKKHLDLTSGRDRGRLWLITQEGVDVKPRAKLGEMSTEQLVAELDSPNGWRRETAARLLYERNDSRVAPALERLAKTAGPVGRIQAGYALRTLNELRVDTVRELLTHSHPHVRRHGLKLAESLTARSAELRDLLGRMTDDDQLIVRYQLAFSLGSFRSPARDEALARLLERDGDNTYVRFAALTSSLDGAGEVLDHLSRSPQAAEKNLASIALLAAQIGRQRQGDDLALLMRVLPRIRSNPRVLQTIVTALGVKENDPLAKQIAAATGGEAQAVMRKIVQSASQAALDESLPLANRTAAVQSLQLGDFAGVREVLDELLLPAQPSELQRAALETAGAFDDDAVADWILSRWLAYTPSLRAAAGDILLSRPAWTPQLLTAIEDERIAASDLEPGRLRILVASNNRSLAERAEKLIAKHSSGRVPEEIVKPYQAALGSPGNTDAGRKLFRQHCAACHRLEGVGHAIGPNLAAMRNRGDQAILLNVLAPNREVNPQYMTYVVQTADGRSLSGIIASESANSIELKRGDNETDQVLRIDIEAMRSTGVSLMPEGFEKKLKPAELVDLIEYLKSAN